MKIRFIFFLVLFALFTFKDTYARQNQLGQTFVLQKNSQQMPQTSNDQLPVSIESENHTIEITSQPEQNFNTKKPIPRSDNARKHMSEVAEKVEELLANPDGQGGIGLKVQEIARSQKESQNQIENNMDKLQSKNEFLKNIFGPDFSAIKNLNRQIEQNRIRIQQLQQIQTEVQNQNEQIQLQQTIESLAQQNTALQEQVRSEEKTKSLFGWLVKLITR